MWGWSDKIESTLPVGNRDIPRAHSKLCNATLARPETQSVTFGLRGSSLIWMNPIHWLTLAYLG
jgi:hypothetical protein